MKKILKVVNGYARKYSVHLLDDSVTYNKVIKDKITFWGNFIGGREYWPNRETPDIFNYSSITLNRAFQDTEFKAPMTAVQKIIPDYRHDKLTEIAFLYTEETTNKFLFFTYKDKEYKMFSLVGEDLERFVKSHKLINTPEAISSGDFEEKYDEQELLDFTKNLETGKLRVYF